jgi:hypothetical protein
MRLKKERSDLIKKTLIIGFCLSVIIVFSFFAGLQYFLHSRTKEEISKRVNEISYVESLGYEKLKVGFRGNRFDLSNVSLKIKGVKEIIRAKEISVFNVKTNNRHLLESDVEIKGMGIPLKSLLSDESYQALDIIYPDELFSNIGWHYQYDPQQKVLALENIKIFAPELANVEANIELMNFDPSIILLNNPVGSLPHLLGISVSHADVTYHDHSLWEKIFSAQNTSRESDLPAAFEVISENVYHMLQNEKDEKTRVVLENILKFINNPEKFHITLLPEKPVPLGRFLWVRHLKEFVELLNMKIET